MPYQIDISDDARDYLRGLEARDRRLVGEKISELAENPRPRGSQMKGYPGLRKKRAGNYRIVYKVENRAIKVLVLVIADRREVYPRVARFLRGR
ncbi:MAG TPA: type II toxin-antitoxin system RelE/ParE family toxin [Phycisphaerales bacterium]|nr:type II toxin-antitoxin system RelE/ParE family toxin [Phycisphaerales bacterium]